MANMVSYTNQLTAAGIGYVVVSPFANNVVDMSGYDALLKAQYQRKFISGYQLTKVTGSSAMNTAYNPGGWRSSQRCGAKCDCKCNP